MDFRGDNSSRVKYNIGNRDWLIFVRLDCITHHIAFYCSCFSVFSYSWLFVALKENTMDLIGAGFQVAR